MKENTSEIKLSKRDGKKNRVDAHIDRMHSGDEFCANDIAIALSSNNDIREKQRWRVFLTGYLPIMVNKGLLKFVGWRESGAPVQKKVYRKV